MKKRLTAEELSTFHDGLCGVSIGDGDCSCLVHWVLALQKELDEKELQIDDLKRQAKTDVHVMGEISKARDTIVAERDTANRLYNELLNAADALLGKMGGPNSPVQPAYEDEFLSLELMVDRHKGQDVESIEKRASENRNDEQFKQCAKCGAWKEYCRC